MKGEYVVVNGYRFKGFVRTGFDLFTVTDNHIDVSFEIFNDMNGKEVEIITNSDCGIYSRAIVKMCGMPEITEKEITANFSIVYFTDRASGERVSKGGFYEELP